MIFIVQTSDRSIIGTADAPFDPPGGCALVEGPNLAIALVYCQKIDDQLLIAEIPPQPTPDTVWDGQKWVAIVPSTPEIEPNWDSAVAEFQYPGNPLYSSVWIKVKAAGDDAKDHWANLKALLGTANLRSLPALIASINYLASLLADAGHELSEEDKSAWNDLMTQHNFSTKTHLT